MGRMRSMGEVIVAAGLVVGAVTMANPAHSSEVANPPLVVNCGFLTMAEVFATPGCGWCGETARGVRGTGLGPLEPCLPATYLYTAPRSTPG